MFGFSRPRCPVDPAIAQWVESSMGWLASRFGESILLKGKVILPNKAFFPIPISGTVADLTPLFDRVSVYMRIDPESIDLRFFTHGRQANLGGGLVIASEGAAAAGLYRGGLRRPIISINIEEGIGVTSYVATMAHELAHVHLIGGNHVDPNSDDHEPLTDLATVFFGLGVFNANNVVTDTQWSANGWSGWSIGRHGYLPEDVFGYAFAVYAWRRGERKPLWARYLRPNVRDTFKKGLRYLASAGSRAYAPDEAADKRVSPYPGMRMDQ